MDDAPETNTRGDYTGYDGPAIRWDDATITKEAGHLPPELREPFVYLKSYTRERCSRDVDLLVVQFKRLNVHCDKTTWTKILRGRWNRNSRGEELPNPVLAADKLLRYITALQINTREEALRGKVAFVETSTWTAISDYIDTKRARDRVNRFGIVIGHTGSQKTACFKEYVRRHNHGSTWWFEAPAGGSVGSLLDRLGACSGLSEQTNTQKKRTHLLRCVQEEKVIIIDNAQDLYIHGRENLGAFNWLRQLQDETSCCIILSITPLFEKELVSGIVSSYFEQFVGRSGGVQKWLRLPAYAPEEDVLAIGEAFGLLDAKKSLRTLVAISREPGRVRRLFDDLQDAKRLATARREKLTIDHLVEIRGED